MKRQRLEKSRKAVEGAAKKCPVAPRPPGIAGTPAARLRVRFYGGVEKVFWCCGKTREAVEVEKRNELIRLLFAVGKCEEVVVISII